jgi:Tfp pilus assembly protein PilZ
VQHEADRPGTEHGDSDDGGDAFELASEYLELMRRWRSGNPALEAFELERRNELRDRLEGVLAKGEPGDDLPLQRRYLRVPTLHKVEFSDGERRVSGLLTEIAEGGVFVSTERPFPAGTPLEIEIVAENDSRHLARGEVRWIRERQIDGFAAGMGIAFRGLDDAQFGAIVDLMEKALFLSFAQES